MNILKGKNANNVVRVGFLIVLLLGLFLRGYQYFMNRPLWHDEAHLALNFIYFGYQGLVNPLAHWQSAPILFLFSVETCTKLFGFGELSLRLTPFIVSVLTLPVFYFLCYELTKNRVISLVAFLLFSVNISFVYYSSELKPYTIDACMFVVIPWMVISTNNYIKKHRALLLTVAACIAVLMTNTSIVILFCMALYIFIQFRAQAKATAGRKVDTVVSAGEIWFLGVVLVVFLANFILFIESHPYAAGMKYEWASTFWPINFWDKEFVDFIDQRMTDTFQYLIQYSTEYKFDYVFLFLFLVGIASVVKKRDKKIVVFVLLPVIIQIVLSMLKLYPFYARFVLNILPAALILFSIGLYRVATFVSARTHYISAVVIIVVGLFFMIKDSISKFPRWDIDIKPSLEYINEHYPDMPVLVTTPATLYEYYRRTEFVKNSNNENIPWDLTPETYMELEQVTSKHSNYILLHSAIGGDNSEPVIEALYKKGLVVKDFKDNNFAVTEIKPITE